MQRITAKDALLHPYFYPVIEMNEKKKNSTTSTGLHPGKTGPESTDFKKK